MACRAPSQRYCIFSSKNYREAGSFFCKDEFIMHREIWMSQTCHAHNCRAVQKNEPHPKTAGLLQFSFFYCNLSSDPFLSKQVVVGMLATFSTSFSTTIAAKKESLRGEVSMA